MCCLTARQVKYSTSPDSQIFVHDLSSAHIPRHGHLKSQCGSRQLSCRPHFAGLRRFEQTSQKRHDVRYRRLGRRRTKASARTVGQHSLIACSPQDFRESSLVNCSFNLPSLLQVYEAGRSAHHMESVAVIHNVHSCTFAGLRLEFEARWSKFCTGATRHRVPTAWVSARRSCAHRPVPGGICQATPRVAG